MNELKVCFYFIHLFYTYKINCYIYIFCKPHSSHKRKTALDSQRIKGREPKYATKENDLSQRKTAKEEEKNKGHTKQPGNNE